MKTVYVMAGIVLFLLFVPVIPLNHSNPANYDPHSYVWPDFYGSVTRSVLQCGLDVSGVGIWQISCYPLAGLQK